jgi:hypothetical protein
VLPASAGFLHLNPEHEGGYVPQKLLTFSELHGVETQKIVIFKQYLAEVHKLLMME